MCPIPPPKSETVNLPGPFLQASGGLQGRWFRWAFLALAPAKSERKCGSDVIPCLPLRKSSRAQSTQRDDDKRGAESDSFVP